MFEISSDDVATGRARRRGARRALLDVCTDLEGAAMAELPSVAQMRPVTQPAAVTGRPGAEHWTGTLYLRRISPYLTRLLLPTGISPNGVTWLMITAGGAAGAVLLVPGLPGAVLAALLAQAQMLLDCSDGELARWRQSFSATGVFLDKLGHFVAETLIPIGLGVRADGGLGSIGGWTTLGALLSVLVVLNRSLNEMVHASRARAGLAPLAERSAVGVPTVTPIRRLRSIARFVPFHRAYHSVELTLLVLVAALADWALGGGLPATRLLLAGLLAAAVLTVVGHVAAILTSSKLR
jgi:phosphatidylglycerophosphate synthase